MSNKDIDFTEVNSEFGFLYKKCSNVGIYTITLIANVQEYMEELRKHKDDSFDENHLYEVLKPVALKMLSEHKMYRVARDAIKKISKAVTGNPHAWEKE